MKVSLLFILIFPFVCQGYTISVSGPGMAINLESIFDLKRYGVTATAGSGAITKDDDIRLAVDASSMFFYSDDLTDLWGQLVLMGEIILSSKSNNAKVTLANFVMDLETSAMTATIDQVPVTIGTINYSATVYKAKGTTSVEIILKGLEIVPALPNAINLKLGTALQVPDEMVAPIAFDVDMANGTQVNYLLTYDFKLSHIFSPYMTLSYFRNFSFRRDFNF